MVQNEWKKYLAWQAKRHPSMEPQDVYKMIFQAAFGAEHLLQDREAAYHYFQKEYEALEPKDELLWEQISEKIYRVNMRAWKFRKLPAKWLFEMFVGSVSRQEEEKQDFKALVETATDTVKEGCFSFGYEDFGQYTEEYNKQGIRPVHHSENYRKTEQPAYRLVTGEYLRVLPILEVMAENGWKAMEASVNGESKTPFIVAIDGRCASGKSTMARILSEVTGAGVVHMDDFFLPMELRTKERLAEPGGNVHYERFMEEVLPFLKEKGEFSYRRFDCSKMQPGENHLVADSLYRVVEGAYSHHPLFGEYADLKVFSRIEPEEQLVRIAARDGEAVLAMFRECWIPMEEKYFSTYQTKEKSDLRI